MNNADRLARLFNWLTLIQLVIVADSGALLNGVLAIAFALVATLAHFASLDRSRR